jgi:hypothetical protein
MSMNIKPEKEHQWLQRLVGDWSCDGEALMPGDEKPVKWTGTETVRSIGGLWIVAEGRSAMPGADGESDTMMTLGYDPKRKRFVGTFIGSMMTHLWVYDGALDAAAKTLTLDAEGPADGEGKKMAKFKDEITYESDDHRVLTSRMLGEDGKWTQFMTAHYRRRR